MDFVPGTPYKIIQGEGALSYSLDSLFLSYFARPKGQVLDLGCGQGILFFRLLEKKIKSYTGLDLNEKALAYFRQSLTCQDLPFKPRLLDLDVKDLKAPSAFDTVITNPPYFKGQLLTKDPGLNLSKHEGRGSLDLFIQKAAYSLKPLGYFYLVLPQTRLVDGLVLMRTYKLEPKRAQSLSKKRDRGPSWFALEGRKGARPGLLMEPCLNLGEDYQKIYEMQPPQV